MMSISTTPILRTSLPKTSCKEVEIHGNGDKTVVLVDCGTKHNIIRCLTRRNVKVIRVPWDYDFMTIPYDGLFISNGPGNPDMAQETIKKHTSRHRTWKTYMWNMHGQSIAVTRSWSQNI